MQDKYTGEAGTFIVDSESGVRVPEQDLAIYQSDKSAYLIDKDAAITAFNSKATKKTVKPTEEI